MVRPVRPARSRRRMLAALVLACAGLATVVALPVSADRAGDARCGPACLAGVDMLPAKTPGPFVWGTAFAVPPGVPCPPEGSCRFRRRGWH